MSALVKRYVGEDGSDIVRDAMHQSDGWFITLDALHLAAALVLPPSGLVFATWDRRLHAAAGAEGLELLPAALS